LQFRRSANQIKDATIGNLIALVLILLKKLYNLGRNLVSKTNKIDILKEKEVGFEPNLVSKINSKYILKNKMII